MDYYAKATQHLGWPQHRGSGENTASLPLESNWGPSWGTGHLPENPKGILLARVEKTCAEICGHLCRVPASQGRTCALSRAVLQPLPVPERSWQMVSLDFIGPPRSANHNCILVVVGKLTKYANCMGCLNILSWIEIGCLLAGCVRSYFDCQVIEDELGLSSSNGWANRAC
jgi:hypothetical protein